jgi:hypothetical protein
MYSKILVVLELFTGEQISNDINKMSDQNDILDDLVEGAMEDNVIVRDYKAACVIEDHGKGKTLKNKDKK